MSEEIEEKAEFVRNQKPSGLEILLVLSWISSVFWTIVNFLMLLFCAGLQEGDNNEFMTQMETQMTTMGYGAEQIDIMHQMFMNGTSLFGAGLLASVMTIIALVNLGRMKKVGFHLYVGARLIETFMPLVIAGGMFFSVFTLFLSAVFIYFYSRFLKLMD